MPISPIPWTILSGTALANPFTITNVTVTVPWILACPSWRSITHLQIAASGVWRQEGDSTGDCEADGRQGASVPIEQLAVTDCPPGALIGKLGGSSASLGPASGTTPNPAPLLAEGKAFAIGSFCTIALPTGCIGPLYVAFNGLKLPVRVNSLTVTIKGAPSGT
jgi:hypothetical protein